jgi:hypothetical protein
MRMRSVPNLGLPLTMTSMPGVGHGGRGTMWHAIAPSTTCVGTCHATLAAMKRILLFAVVSLAGLAGCTADDEHAAPIDAPPASDCGCVSDTLPDSINPCGACGAGTICVQLLGGTCGTLSVTCEPVVTGCEQPVCSTACDQAYCDPGGISTCQAAGCAADLPGAFHCYGV